MIVWMHPEGARAYQGEPYAAPSLCGGTDGCRSCSRATFARAAWALCDHALAAYPRRWAELSGSQWGRRTRAGS